MKFFTALIICLPLLSCQTSPQPEVGAALKSSKLFTTTETFSFGNFSAPAWESDTFSGSHSRRVEDGILEFSVEQDHSEGGLDLGLNKLGYFEQAVSAVPKETVVCSTYDIDLEGLGRWWAGPKISVNWQGDEAAKQNGDDWYENYIVEIASSSPQELHDIFTGDYFKAAVLPETVLSGSVYKHYKIRFHSWWQFWSVRQDYRDSGTLLIQPILDVWKENGLPEERQLDGVKANIETYGPIKGTGRLSIDVASSSAETLSGKL